MSHSRSLIQAAMVLKRLTKSQAAAVISRLQPAEIKRVLKAIEQLGDSSDVGVAEAQRRLVRESQPAGIDHANQERLQNQISSDIDGSKIDAAEPGSSADSKSSVEPGTERPFEFVIGIAPSIRQQLLEDEHPQQIAIVLSLLPPDVASETMNRFDSMTQLSILKRICEIDEINEEDVVRLSNALKTRFKKMLSTTQRNSAGVELAADLLSCTDQDAQESMIAYVGQTDPDLALKLKRTVFRIEDLALLDDSSLRLLLGSVDTSVWAPALKHAPYSLKTRIFSCMAAKPAEWLAHEIEQLGKLEPTGENHARQTIIQAVLKLAREGQIDLRTADGPSPIPPPNYRAAAPATSPIS